VTLSTLKKIPGLETAHLEGMRGNIKENERYCSKADDLSYFGEAFVEPGQRRDVARAYEMVKEGKSNLEIMEYDFALYARLMKAIDRLRLELKPVRDGPPLVLMLIGRPGCGKTRQCYMNYPDLWEQPINMSKTDTNWFDGYHGQKAVLLDEFEGHMPLNSLLKLIDRYMRQVPIKGGFVWFNPEIIMLTANQHPSEWYDFANRRDKEKALRRRVSRVAYWDELNNDFITFNNDLLEGELASNEMKRWWPIEGDIRKTVGEVLMPKVIQVEDSEEGEVSCDLINDIF